MPDTTSTPTALPPHAPDARLLRRAVEGRMLAGVAAGLANYFDLDVALVRVAIVVLALMGGVALPLYIAAWFLIPEEGTDQTVATDLLDHLRA
ncbi:MAG TPA: PspC domain-containing protein [Acidimicrobiales bacterium]|nr:PspC domain-containing protein [Acidimicrobiales bacterium]